MQINAKERFLKINYVVRHWWGAGKNHVPGEALGCKNIRCRDDSVVRSTKGLSLNDSSLVLQHSYEAAHNCI